MKLKVLDKSGKEVEEITLAKDVFGVKPNTALLAQYLRVFMSNQRQGTSSTKTRGDVSGGGKKPWRQKGTGRARVGSTRNPLWRHGGIAHGPLPKSWKLSFPNKMKKIALSQALSSKYTQNQITILDKLNMKTPKTKTIAELLHTLKLSGKTLVVLDDNDFVIRRSANNIQSLQIALAGNLSAFDILQASNVVFLKKALLAVQDKYAHK